MSGGRAKTLAAYAGLLLGAVVLVAAGIAFLARFGVVAFIAAQVVAALVGALLTAVVLPAVARRHTSVVRRRPTR